MGVICQPNRFTHHSLDSRLVTGQTTRERSAALFGNEKLVEVVVALAEQRGAATAQQLSKDTGIDHSMVRSVLLRAVSAGVVETLPRTGGARSPQYYQPTDTDVWRATLALARAVAASTDQDRRRAKPRAPLKRRGSG
jgi:predicted ArsR family transcriptional regulator